MSEKFYAVAGPAFGDQQDSIIIIENALYGLKSSSRAFRNYFADHLRSAEFQPTRYDCDVWIRKRESGDGYDYIYTHVDDFKIIAKDPDRLVGMIEAKFFSEDYRSSVLLFRK